jgi:hypothetical protein
MDGRAPHSRFPDSDAAVCIVEDLQTTFDTSGGREVPGKVVLAI